MKDIEQFKDWLINNGCDILPVTNEFEDIRFKGKEVGVIYKSGKTSNSYSLKAIVCFRNKKKWDGRPVNVGRLPGYRKEKIALLERDGSDCFYCGDPMHNDISLEHLIPLVAGGKNNISNMVLCHEKCNQEAGVLSVVDKVKLAIKKRNESNNRL